MQRLDDLTCTTSCADEVGKVEKASSVGATDGATDSVGAALAAESTLTAASPATSVETMDKPIAVDQLPFVTCKVVEDSKTGELVVSFNWDDNDNATKNGGGVCIT